jgi:hypothetical protein
VADELTFSFRGKEVEAMVRALDECGANGQPRVALERLRDPELVRAATTARRVLLGKQQHQSFSKPEPLRELDKPDPKAELREAYRSLKQDYMEVLGAALELIKGLPDALEHAENYRPQEAAAALKTIMGRVRFSSEQLGNKLWQMENDKAEKAGL